MVCPYFESMRLSLFYDLRDNKDGLYIILWLAPLDTASFPCQCFKGLIYSIALKDISYVTVIAYIRPHKYLILRRLSVFG